MLSHLRCTLPHSISNNYVWITFTLVNRPHTLQIRLNSPSKARRPVHLSISAHKKQTDLPSRSSFLLIHASVVRLAAAFHSWRRPTKNIKAQRRRPPNKVIATTLLTTTTTTKMGTAKTSTKSSKSSSCCHSSPIKWFKGLIALVVLYVACAFLDSIKVRYLLHSHLVSPIVLTLHLITSTDGTSSTPKKSTNSPKQL